MRIFGLAAAEAMASGCIVLGFHGWVAEELFNANWSYPVAPGDKLGFLQAVQRMMTDRTRHPDAFERKRELGRSHIVQHYNGQSERDALQTIFGEIRTLVDARRSK